MAASILPPVTTASIGSSSIATPVGFSIKEGSQVIPRQFLPQQSFASFFSANPVMVDFDYPVSSRSSEINYLQDAYIQFTLVNSGSDPVLLLPTNAWFSQMQLLIDQAPMVQYYPQSSFWMQEALRSTVAAGSVAALEAVAAASLATTYSSYSFAPGTQTFTLPLKNLTFMENNVLLQSISSRIQMRVYFNPGNLCVASTTTEPYTSVSCTNMQLICTGQKLSEAAYQIARANSLKCTTIVPQVTVSQKNVNVGDCTAHIPTAQFVINGPGANLGMLFLINTAGAVQETALQPVATDQIILYTAEGSQYNSGQILTDLLLRQEALDYFPLSPVVIPTCYLSNYVYMSFCKYAFEGLSNTRIHGSYRQSGQESVSVATTANLSNGVIQMFQFLPQFASIDPTGRVQIKYI
jgi:hypothetical protein